MAAYDQSQTLKKFETTTDKEKSPWVRSPSPFTQLTSLRPICPWFGGYSKSGSGNTSLDWWMYSENCVYHSLLLMDKKRMGVIFYIKQCEKTLWMWKHLIDF